MPTTETQSQSPKSYTEVYKKLIRTKCPDVLEDPQMQVFASIITSLAERLDTAVGNQRKLEKSMELMAKMLVEMASGDEPAAAADETIEGEAGMTGAATGSAGGTGGAVGASGPSRKQDATPFPAGVSATVAGAAAAPAPTATASAAAAAPVANDPEDLTPNAGGGGAVNAQPIPNGPSGPPNQSRVVNVQKNGRKGADA